MLLVFFSFSQIIFMFPHIGGKMKIHLNRRLLRDFGQSAVSLMGQSSSSSESRVIVSLCGGQGGTPKDPVKRAEADNWQVFVEI